MENELLENSNFIMYTTDDGQVEIEVRLEDENVWLTQNAMAELFNTTTSNINMHIKNIYTENELNEFSTIKDSLIVRQEGNRNMTMEDWKKELDSFLTMTHKEILQGAGTISHEKALQKAHEEYDKYMRTHLTQAEKDYLEIIGEDIKKLNE